MATPSLSAESALPALADSRRALALGWFWLALAALIGAGAVDVGEVQKLTEAMNTLAAKLNQTVPASWPAISRAFFYSESYADRTDIRKGSKGLSSVDLLDLLKRIRQGVAPFPADKEYQDIVGIMDRAVIASSVSPRHRLSHGLAIYAPTTSQQYNAQYEEVQLARTGAWPKLLASLAPLLRAYVACGEVLFGDARQADLVEIHKSSGKVTFLTYSAFDSCLLPELQTRTKVNLRTLSIDVFDHSGQGELLYFKDFLGAIGFDG